MVDFASGNMGGTPGLNPWSDNNSIHQSLGGMHQFGQTNSYMPTAGMMFGSEAQMYYSQPASNLAMQPYRRREQTMQDFSLFGSYIPHKILGRPYAIGESEAMKNVGFNEQADLFKANLGFEIAGTAANIGGGVAGIYASSLLGGIATGGIGMVASAAISSARDTYFENYQRTSRVSGMTNRLVGKDGSRGFSSSQNVDMAKFLGSEAASDPLLDIQDMTNIATLASSTGLLSSENDIRGAKGKIKELTKTLKGIADLTGSSDLRGLMSELKKMASMGIDLQGSKNLISRLSTATDVAGLDRGLTSDINNSAMMSARTGKYSTEYSASANSTRNIEDIRYFQGRDSSGRLNDDRTAIQAGISGDRKVTELGQRAYNLNESALGVAASIVKKEKGISIKDALAEVSRGGVDEVRDRLTSIASNAQSPSDRKMMQRAIGDRSYATDVVRSSQELSSLDLGKPVLHTMYKEIGKTLKSKHQMATPANISAYGRDNGIEFSSSELAMVTEKVATEIDPIRRKSYERYRKTTDSMAKVRESTALLDRTAEKGSLYYRAIQTKDEFKNYFRENVVGGFNAASMQNQTSITALYGLSSGSGNSGVSLPSLSMGMDRDFQSDNGIGKKEILSGTMRSINPVNTIGLTSSGKKLAMAGDGSRLDSSLASLKSYLPFTEIGANSTMLKSGDVGEMSFDQKRVYSSQIREMQSTLAEDTLGNLSKGERQKAMGLYASFKGNDNFSNLDSMQIKAIAIRAATNGATVDEVVALSKADEGITEGGKKNGYFNNKAFHRDEINLTQKAEIRDAMKKDFSEESSNKGFRLMRDDKRKNELSFISDIMSNSATKESFLESAATKGISFDRAISLASRIDSPRVAELTLDAMDSHSKLGLVSSQVATKKDEKLFDSQSDTFKSSAQKVSDILNKVDDPKKREELDQIIKSTFLTIGAPSEGVMAKKVNKVLKNTNIGVDDSLDLINNIQSLEAEGDGVDYSNVIGTLSVVDKKKRKEYTQLKEKAAKKISSYFEDSMSYSDSMDAIDIYTKEREGTRKERYQSIQAEFSSKGYASIEDISNIIQTSTIEQKKEKTADDKKQFQDGVITGIDGVNKNIKELIKVIE